MHLPSVSGPRFHLPFLDTVAAWLILVTFLLLPSLCKAQAFAADGVEFGDGSSNVYSAADVGPDGKFYVLWKDGSVYQTTTLTIPRYKLIRWEAQTSSWTTLGTILGDTDTFPNIITGTANSRFGDRMALKVDSQGRFHIAMHIFFTTGAAIVYGTSATGSAWTFTTLETNNNTSNYSLSDPQLDLDPDGKPHVVFRIADNSSSDSTQRPTRIRRHVFNGTSWSGETVYSRTGSLYAINGGVGYAIDSLGSGHLAIPVETNGSGTDASLFYLINSSGTWSSPVNLAAGASSNAAVLSLDLAVDPQDKVHIVRRDLAYNLHHHTNASGTWQGAQINSNLQGNIDYDSLTVNSQGDLLLAYNTHTGTNVGNVAYACRFTGESSWQTGPVMSGNSRTGQYFSVAFKSDRTAMILFDHFTGTGIGTGIPTYASPDNPRQLQYATAVISPPVSAPAAPTSLIATAGDGQASVAFTAGANGGSAITNYEFSTNDGTSWTAFNPAVTASPAVISGLTNGTAYSIRLRAVSAAGNGAASAAVSATPRTIPSAPTALVATAGDGQASVAFTAGADGGSAITNYEFSTNDGRSWTAFNPAVTASPAVISGLTNGTAYSIRLRAVNAAGNGAASAAVSATPRTIPSAPTALVATAGDGQASVAFTAGANGGSTLTHYEFSTNDGTSWTAFNPAVTASPVVISGLTNGSAYSIRLRAVNAAGNGAASAAVSATPRTTPSAPTSLVATAGEGLASVAFTAGADGGSAITNYEFSTNNGNDWTAFNPAITTSPAVITQLTNGIAYSIRLRAVNAAGNGAASAAVSGTPRTTPSAPTSLVATAGDGQVSVAFTAGADGGSAITNYEFSTNDGTSWTALNPAVTTSPAVITGLTNGTAYSIRLRAVNAAGNGAASDAVSSTPVDPPIVFRAASKAAAMTSISVVKLTSKAGGVLGTAVSVSSVAATSEQGATVALAGSAIQYTPALGFSGVDRFRVTFTSSAGAIVGLIEMTTAVPSHLANPARLTPLSGGRMGIQFNGIPGVAYQLQRSTDLASWTTIATITAGSRGAIDFTDDNPPAPNGFYRLATP